MPPLSDQSGPAFSRMRAVMRWARMPALDQSVWRLILLSGLVGLLSGFGAIVFHVLLEGATHFFLGGLAGYLPALPGGETPLFDAPSTEFRRWALLVLPAAGALLSGFLVTRFAPEARGHGTDAAIDAYHRKAGMIRGRVPVIKTLASALTIGSGGSGGGEGPISQIGAGCGSWLAGLLRLGPRERRVLLAAGMAGGIGAFFHTPLAGALFAAEVLYRDMDLEFEVIVPSVVSSVIAYAVFASIFGWTSLFETPDFVFRRPMELLPYLFLAVVVALGAVLYIRVFYGIGGWFERLHLHACWKPAAGAVLVGCIGYFLPEALCGGYGVLQKALVAGSPLEAKYGSLGPAMLWGVFFAKILTTSLSIGSGGSGGVFGPGIVIGGMLGGGTGILLQTLFPGLGIQVGAFVLVGMAGFFAAAARTPMTMIIMVSELTGNYHLLVPAMGVCMIAFALVRRDTLYTSQLRNRYDAPAHRCDMMAAVLGGMTVRDVLLRQPAGATVSVQGDTGLHRLLEIFSSSEQTSFPVVDEQDRLTGILKARDLRSTLAIDHRLDAAIIADDLARPPITVIADDTLDAVIARMAAYDLDDVAVVDAEQSAHLLRLLSYRDIVGAYQAELNRRKTDDGV